jgi:hypothetical protein
MITALLLMALAAPQGAAAPQPTPTPRPEGSQLARLAAERSKTTPSSSSLAEVASRVKLRLPEDGEGRRITNQNLKELAAGAELTQVHTSGSLGAVGEAALGSREDWQRQYQLARGHVRFLEQEVDRLARAEEELKSRFYAHDDPAFRDGVVKPTWDRALLELRRRQEELSRARAYPDLVLRDARRAGALPGWFRGLPEPEPVESYERGQGGSGAARMPQ